MIDPELLKILACPWCVTRPEGVRLARAELELVGPADAPTGLKCKHCQRLYAVKDGIVNLLIEEATLPETAAKGK